MIRKIGITIIICSLSLVCFSQQFGGTPPSQRWKQISTDTARIIYPEGMDSAAQRVANIVHYLAATQSGTNGISLGTKLRKINIVFQHNSTVANGYVGLGPYRSEFFLTPVLNNFSEGSLSWNDNLAVHEYRHVEQFNNFENGLSKTMRALFGEEGYSLAINAAVPDWFYEGDAVYNETVVTNQGRGRLPLFNNEYPSLWQSGKKYSWAKLRNGSLKDFVPSHYQLGYLLVNYGREKYGPDFWTKVTRDASSYQPLIYPFQGAIRRYAGVSYKSFRDSAFAYNQRKTERVSITRDEYLFPVNHKYVTSYEFPYSISDDSLLYLKTSYRQRAAFVIKDSRGEHRLRVRDISIDDQFSYRNGRIVYAAFEPDPRWSWRDYSVIKILDVQSGKQTTLTHKSKYFTPDISQSGSKIAAVQISAEGKSELHILDAATGAVLNRIHSSEIILFSDPKFINEESLVTAVRLKDGEMALATAEISSGNTVRLTPPSYNVVGYPCVSDGVVYFTASYEGNDDVFAVRLSDQKITKISDGPLGNYYVNAANGKITWSAFTAEGYQLKQIKAADIQWKDMPPTSLQELRARFAPTKSPVSSDILAGLPGRVFATSNYKKGTRLINLHSWRPNYDDPIVSFTIYGQNILNTLQTEIYYNYNQDDKTSSVGFAGTYGKWFPYLNFGVEYTFNNARVVGNRLREWNQLDTRVGLSVPLDFSSGRSYKLLNFGTNVYYRRDFNQGFFRDSLGVTGFTYLQHFASWTQQVQRAPQHIYPRLGYTLGANFRHAITDYKSWQFSGNATVYLPGLMTNHNLVLTGAWQETDTAVTLFGNRFPYARGYNEAYFSRMWRVSANYHFPIWHPDFGFANIIYLQRIRGNIFYDFMRVYSKDKLNTRDQRTFGGEVYFDTKWWNQYPLTFGFRMSHLLDRDFYTPGRTEVFEFILPISIFPN